ncbi:MAG: hypothetical protein ACYTF7_01320 [Planctomycetota bacterium]|jgi:predicted  nucleic acid-binding Zn-ribbon protein
MNEPFSPQPEQNPTPSHTFDEVPTPENSPDNSEHQRVVERVGAIRQNLDQLREAQESGESINESLSQSFQEWEASLDLREDTLNQRESAIREQRSALESTRCELEELRSSIETTSGELEDRVAELQQRDAESIERAHKLEETLNEARETNQELEFSNGSLGERLRELELELERSIGSQEASDELQRELESIRAERDSLRDEIENHRSSLASLEGELDGLRGALETSRAEASEAGELRERLSRSAADQDALTQDNQSLQEEIGSLRATIENLEHSLREGGASEAQLASMEQQLREACDRRESLEGEVDSMRARLDEAGDHDGQIEGLTQELDRARSDHDGLVARIGELEDQNATLREAIENAEPDTDTKAYESEIARRDLVIEKLSARLEDVEGSRESLQEALDRQHAAGDDTRNSLRMLRLRKMKKLLQSEGKKLSTARRSVAQKHTEAQKVLEQRAALAKEKSTLREREAKITKMARRNSIARVGCMLAIAIGILGYGAWEVAQMVPARFLVNATVQAKGPMADDLNELSAWREHMTSMMTNTRMIDAAADRMKLRGMDEYSSAPKLSELVNNHIDFAFPSPDVMHFSLVGMGDLQTERLLETYLAVFVSVTNDEAASYGGSISASITQSPRAEARPIDTNRQLVLAGGMWGGVTFLVLGVSVWASRAFASATSKLRTDAAEANHRAYSYDGISELPGAA